MIKYLLKLASIVAMLTAPLSIWAGDEESIRSLPIDKWCAAEMARDIDAKMQLFTDDIVFMIPGEQAFSGLDQVRSWHLKGWQGTKYQCSGRIDELQIAGDWGFVRGIFIGSLTYASGATSKDSGKFINIVRKEQQGQWKIARVIWNAN